MKKFLSVILCVLILTSCFVCTAFADEIILPRIPLNNHVHTFKNPVYTWSDDNKTCTAYVKCSSVLCGGNIKETVTAVDDGNGTFTAVFKDSAFSKQVKRTGGPAFTLGDINNDTKVNTKDARLVLQSTAKLVKLDETQMLAADVNNDSKVNTKDARKILRVVAKLEKL